MNLVVVPPGAASAPHCHLAIEATERPVAVVARNIADEQETVAPYDPAED